MPLEAAWEVWLEAAAGVLPSQAVRRMCPRGPRGWSQLRQACNATRSAIGGQALYAVYAHAPPSFPGWLPRSLWDRARIPARVDTRWGDHSLAAATRALLAEAFKDPLAQRFVLLSERDLPLYDPLTTYQQLMSDNRSMINACPGGADLMPWRWSPRMETPRLNSTHWRKSNQFFALTRAHAEVVLQDEEVYSVFERYCRVAFDKEAGGVRDCISDEHYIPTLLASKGLEAEAACDSWGVAALDWSRGGAHPRTYGPGDISAELFHRIRGAEGVERAQASALRQYLNCSVLGEPAKACAALGANDNATERFEPMPRTPKLTARKFAAETAPAVVALFRDCSSGGLRMRPQCAAL